MAETIGILLMCASALVFVVIPCLTVAGVVTWAICNPE